MNLYLSNIQGENKLVILTLELTCHPALKGVYGILCKVHHHTKSHQDVEKDCQDWSIVCKPSMRYLLNQTRKI